MIAKGNVHANGAVLARYLISAKSYEHAELWELRGFALAGIVDAFRSVHVMACATKCRAPFFHVSLRNPEGETLDRKQWDYAVNRIEGILGLGDQPRAVAFHLSRESGHGHVHIAWSRIDHDSLTAKPLPYFKQRLKRASRELERHFGLTPVRNERPSVIRYAPTRAEDEQARRLRVDIHRVRETIRACFEHSDCGVSFSAALAHENLILARGERRDFVVIDHAGGLHALGKRILGVSAAETRARLSDLDHGKLLTVEQAQGRARAQEGGRKTGEPRRDRKRGKPKSQDVPAKTPAGRREIARCYLEPASGMGGPAPGSLGRMPEGPVLTPEQKTGGEIAARQRAADEEEEPVLSRSWMAEERQRLDNEREMTRRQRGFLEIGIGGSLAAPPLPHHRTCGSAYGGSAG